MVRLLPAALVCIALLPACAAEEPSPTRTAGREKAVPAREAAIPAQRRDPEQLKGESASAGASAARRVETSTPPRGATDLGREAEREEEEFRKREQLPGIQK